MNWHELLADGFNRVPAFLKNVLQNLQTEDLDWMPSKESNSIGWLVWHLTRQQDAQVASLAGKEQLWIKDKWFAKFDRDSNPMDIGFGHTPKQVEAFQSPDISTLLEYLEATVESTIQFLKGLSEEDLDRELEETQYHPIPTVGVRLISILDDSVMHAGQAAYIRGMIQGRGWQKY